MRTYSEELLTRATAYVARPERERRLTQASRDELLALHNLITGEQRSWCPACQYNDFYHVVTGYIREATHFFHPETMSDTQYQFAPAYRNESISDERYAKKVTADNLTDEDAEYLIPKGYGHVIVAKSAAAEPAAPAGDSGSEPDSRDYAKDLAAEQKAHAATGAKFQKEQEAHAKTSDALKSEKDAHKATKKELTEVSKQLADAQKQLAKLAETAQDAADKSNPDASTDAPA